MSSEVFFVNDSLLTRNDDSIITHQSEEQDLFYGASFTHHTVQAIFLAGFVSLVTLLLGIFPGSPSAGNLWPFFVPDYHGPRSSTHLFDPYSFVHMGHGILSFYAWGILDNVNRNHFNRQKPKSALHDWWLKEGGLIKAMFMAMAFELIENSSGVIELFRSNSGVSEDYMGDSTINVVGDLMSSALGYNLSKFFVSRGYTTLPLLIFLLEELLLAFFIRDNMILIILQTFFPSDKIREWQSSIIDDKSMGFDQYKHIWSSGKFDKYSQYLRKF